LALSAAVLQTLTDKLVRRAALVTTTPAPNLLLGCTESGLGRYLDASTPYDPELEAALAPACMGIDRQVLAPNYVAFLQAALNNSKWRELGTAIQTYVQSAAGGGYANLGAYLTASGALLHPLFGEIVMQPGGNVFMDGGTAIGLMHPLMQPTSFARVYTGALGALVDKTTDAASVATADVALFATNGHVLVLGSRHRFRYVMGDLSTVGSTDATVIWYYWNGATWAVAPPTHDYTTGFSVNGGLIEFPGLPTWVPTCMDNQGTPAVFDTTQEGDFYYMMGVRTAGTLVAPPVATWLQLVPEKVPATGQMFGCDQPPIALVRITGTNLCEVTVLNAPEWGKFMAPGTANNALKLLALTKFSTNVTFTLGYTNQAGAAKTKAQSVWSSPAAGDVKTVALDGADTAIRGVTAATCVVTTSATSGVFAIVVGDYARAIAAK